MRYKINKVVVFNNLSRIEKNLYKKIPLLAKLVCFAPDQTLSRILYQIYYTDIFFKFFKNNVYMYKLKKCSTFEIKKQIPTLINTTYDLNLLQHTLNKKNKGSRGVAVCCATN